MFSNIKRDFDAGIEKIKWFSSLLSERVRIEIEVFKLLYKSEELKKKRDGLLKKIGEEVYAAKVKGKDIYVNKDIMGAIKEIEAIEPEIKETVQKASEISKIAA